MLNSPGSTEGRRSPVQAAVCAADTPTGAKDGPHRGNRSTETDFPVTTLQAQSQLAAELATIVGEVWDSFLLGDLAALPEATNVPGLVTCANVSLTGVWQGVLMVECDADVADKLSCLLLGTKPGEATAVDIADTLGEIANVIGGNLKNVLPGPTLMSLPVVARSMSPSRVKDAVEVCSVAFRWDDMALRVIVWSAQG
ncbi:MAG: chemotaxis protein CheX [Frankiales bacterium]|nr:chemotaxis protein CheX [Frankiales bacterium]